ncbi:MAG TPA: hypothetical protein VN154_01545 [Rhizomicrobium sp.]|nr:hypothetical protein [Rhizomicrobium sp.]
MILPPSCSQYYYSNTYHNCSGTWYQPAYDAPDISYTAVKPPGGSSTTNSPG